MPTFEEPVEEHMPPLKRARRLQWLDPKAAISSEEIREIVSTAPTLPSGVINRRRAQQARQEIMSVIFGPLLSGLASPLVSLCIPRERIPHEIETTRVQQMQGIEFEGPEPSSPPAPLSPITSLR
jgi:hypothetical protein